MFNIWENNTSKSLTTNLKKKLLPFKKYSYFSLFSKIKGKVCASHVDRADILSSSQHLFCNCISNNCYRETTIGNSQLSFLITLGSIFISHPYQFERIKHTRYTLEWTNISNTNSRLIWIFQAYLRLIWPYSDPFQACWS